MLTPGIELGPRAPKAVHFPTVPSLFLLFPLRTRLICFNHYLKDSVTNEANYNLISAAQLQSGRVVSYGSWGRSCGMSKFNDSIVRMWYIWVLCYCVTSLKAGFVICLNWYVVILSRASLSDDTDSPTVNKKLATLTVWRLGTSQYYVHVKLFWIV